LASLMRIETSSSSRVYRAEICCSELCCFAAKVAQFEQQSVNAQEELKARVNGIVSLQKLLNISRHEYSVLESNLKAAQHELAQQRVQNTDLIPAVKFPNQLIPAAIIFVQIHGYLTEPNPNQTIKSKAVGTSCFRYKLAQYELIWVQ